MTEALAQVHSMSRGSSGSKAKGWTEWHCCVDRCHPGTWLAGICFHAWSRLKMLLQSLACKVVQRDVTLDYVKMGMSDFWLDLEPWWYQFRLFQHKAGFSQHFWTRPYFCLNFQLKASLFWSPMFWLITRIGFDGLHIAGLQDRRSEICGQAHSISNLTYHSGHFHGIFRPITQQHRTSEIEGHHPGTKYAKREAIEFHAAVPWRWV